MNDELMGIIQIKTVAAIHDDLPELYLMDAAVRNELNRRHINADPIYIVCGDAPPFQCGGTVSLEYPLHPCQQHDATSALHVAERMKLTVVLWFGRHGHLGH